LRRLLQAVQKNEGFNAGKENKERKP
jgi:hypothetical protein